MINIEQLEKASTAYYNGCPIMTDAEFDIAILALRDADPDHPFLQRIGAPVPGKLKVKHTIPMGSLSNANNEKEFKAWIPKDKLAICLSHKLDGSSLELIYQDGLFVQTITRGNGDIGEDVTRNVLLSGNIPLSIHSSIISVRCECLIYVDDWHKYFKGDANPRNSAAGTLRRHDGRNAQFLRFYAFDALINRNDADNHVLMNMKYEDCKLWLLSKWFDIPHYTSSEYLDKLIEWYQREEAKRDRLPYEIDGIVASVNDRFESNRMGDRDGRPKGQIAFKFKPRGGETILQDVTWQVGQTGALTPVGEVAPIGVGGVVIKRVTLCNMDEIDRLGIAIGDTVEVIRAGDVVPKLLRCIRRGDRRQIILLPQECPECGSKTEKDGARLFCRNDLCEGKSLGRTMTWIRKRNILNLGIEIVKAAKIKSIYDLYQMTKDDWAKIQVGNGNLGRKRADKIITALEKSKSVSLSEFLGSIGIKGVGRSLTHDLCEGLGLKTLDNVLALTPKVIDGQEGFGISRAVDFCQWLKDHQVEVEELAMVMNFESETGLKSGAFIGEKICFTGKSPKPRSEMSKLAEAAGASVSSSITSDTTILVIADPDSTSSKAVKARAMGIKLMMFEDFLEMIKK